MRISSVPLANAVSSNYRIYIPAYGLKNLGHGLYEEPGTAEIARPDILMNSDAVIFFRRWKPPTRRLARKLSEMGIAVIFDNDDDLTSIPRDVAGYLHSGGSRAYGLMRDMRAMMNESHLVTTTNETLADRFREITTTPVRVVDNFIAERTMNVRRDPHPGLVLGWMAGKEHQADYQRLQLRQVFERLLERHPQLSIVSIGLGMGLRSDRYRHVPTVDFVTLTQHCAQFDLAIAPLTDIQFNRCRSTIKLKEYAAAGTPWIASDVGPYRGFGSAQGGLLTDNDGWYEAIDRLLGDADARRTLARNGRTWVRGETIERNAGAWEAVVREAVQRAAAAVASPERG